VISRRGHYELDIDADPKHSSRRPTELAVAI
jgi:hypothetical protein